MPSKCEQRQPRSRHPGVTVCGLTKASSPEQRHGAFQPAVRGRRGTPHPITVCSLVMEMVRESLVTLLSSTLDASKRHPATLATVLQVSVVAPPATVPIRTLVAEARADMVVFGFGLTTA